MILKRQDVFIPALSVPRLLEASVLCLPDVPVSGDFPAVFPAAWADESLEDFFPSVTALTTLNKGMPANKGTTPVKGAERKEEKDLSRVFLRAGDLPGARTLLRGGAEIPILADGEARYPGEPWALWASEDPEELERAEADWHRKSRDFFSNRSSVGKSDPPESRTEDKTGSPRLQEPEDQTPSIREYIQERREGGIRIFCDSVPGDFSLRNSPPAPGKGADTSEVLGEVRRVFSLSSESLRPAAPVAACAVPGKDRLILYTDTPVPQLLEENLCRILKTDPDKIELRLQAQEPSRRSAQRFSLRIAIYAALLSRAAGRPVRVMVPPAFFSPAGLAGNAEGSPSAEAFYRLWKEGAKLHAEVRLCLKTDLDGAGVREQENSFFFHMSRPSLWDSLRLSVERQPQRIAPPYSYEGWGASAASFIQADLIRLSRREEPKSLLDFHREKWTEAGEREKPGEDPGKLLQLVEKDFDWKRRETSYRQSVQKDPENFRKEGRSSGSGRRESLRKKIGGPKRILPLRGIGFHWGLAETGSFEETGPKTRRKICRLRAVGEPVHDQVGAQNRGVSFFFPPGFLENLSPREERIKDVWKKSISFLSGTVPEKVTLRSEEPAESLRNPSVDFSEMSLFCFSELIRKCSRELRREGERGVQENTPENRQEQEVRKQMYVPLQSIGGNRKADSLSRAWVYAAVETELLSGMNRYRILRVHLLADDWSGFEKNVTKDLLLAECEQGLEWGAALIPERERFRDDSERPEIHLHFRESGTLGNGRRKPLRGAAFRAVSGALLLSLDMTDTPGNRGGGEPVPDETLPGESERTEHSGEKGQA